MKEEDVLVVCGASIVPGHIHTAWRRSTDRLSPGTMSLQNSMISAAVPMNAPAHK